MNAIKTKPLTRPSARYLELIREFPLRRLRTRGELAAATKILDRLVGRENADVGETEYLDVLSDLVDAYERENDSHYESDATGIEVLRAMMEEHQMKQAVLADKLGISAPAMSLILSGDRPITADHARGLGKIFSLDPGIFI